MTNESNQQNESNELQGKVIAILAADGVEKVELEQPREALLNAPAPALTTPQAGTTTSPPVTFPAVVSLAGSAGPKGGGTNGFAAGAAVLALLIALGLWLMAGRRPVDAK